MPKEEDISKIPSSKRFFILNAPSSNLWTVSGLSMTSRFTALVIRNFPPRIFFKSSRTYKSPFIERFINVPESSINALIFLPPVKRNQEPFLPFASQIQEQAQQGLLSSAQHILQVPIARFQAASQCAPWIYHVRRL